MKGLFFFCLKNFPCSSSFDNLLSKYSWQTFMNETFGSEAFCPTLMPKALRIQTDSSAAEQNDEDHILLRSVTFGGHDAFHWTHNKHLLFLRETCDSCSLQRTACDQSMDSSKSNYKTHKSCLCLHRIYNTYRQEQQANTQKSCGSQKISSIFTPTAHHHCVVSRSSMQTQLWHRYKKTKQKKTWHIVWVSKISF